jgi:nucleotide-binding universal stress UspA family protein
MVEIPVSVSGNRLYDRDREDGKEVAMKTIVVGYDETDAAKRALARAAELVQAFKAKLIVTSVARVLTPGPRGMGGVDPADPLELHEEELAHAKAFLSERGIEAAYQPAVGDPAGAIIETAEREHADLIVVGTREPGMVERLLGLSVSASVARKSHCDVLIVH